LPFADPGIDNVLEAVLLELIDKYIEAARLDCCAAPAGRRANARIAAICDN
jgi:hypothetical protein